MQITVMSEDGRVTALEVEPAESLDNVRAIVEAELGLPMAAQTLVVAGRVLSPGTQGTLQEAGVTPNDLIHVRVETSSSGPSAPAATATAAQPRSRAASGATRRRGMAGALGGAAALSTGPVIDASLHPSLTWEDLPNNIGTDELHRILQVNDGMMREIERRDPAMYTAARDPTSGKLRALLMKRHLQHALPEAERAAKMAQLEQRLALAPFDVEAQRELEHLIQQKNIEANMELAYEHMPEAFTRVYMLYINCEVNGTAVKAFVDSGAQSTIMSKRCAERCGIMRLVDTKFAGRAVGVGSAPIIGRVHMAQMRIGDTFFQFTATVLDSEGVEFLFGLDLLKRYQAMINLKENVLVLHLGDQAVRVPFLGESDLPRGELGSDSMDVEDSAQDASNRTGRTDGARPPPQPAQPVPATGAASTTTTTQPADSAATVDARLPAPQPATQPHSAVGSPGLIDLSTIPGFGQTGARGSARAGPAARQPVRAPAVPQAAVSPGQPAAGCAAATANEGDLAMLMAMGYAREKCVAALAMSNGDVQLAAGLLPDL